MSPPATVLTVRLRNWVGDVVLGLPLLQRLADAGHRLQLTGKGWAQDLLAGHGWAVQPLPKTMVGRIAQLRALRSAAPVQDGDAAGGLNAVCLPYSFSSALEFRLAGLRTLGHAWEGRSLLLQRAVPRPPRLHELQVYWRLGDALLGRTAPLPERIGLRPSATHFAQAAALRAQHGIAADSIFICPFAGGTWDKQPKTWPGFAAFVAHELPAFGRDIAVCPGPGEEALAREQFPTARLLPDVGLGAYAALLHDAALMVSNDTGPGHIAAAVGAPLVSVLGPSNAAQWGAWGPTVQFVQGPGGDTPWPATAAVRDAVARALATPAR